MREYGKTMDMSRQPAPLQNEPEFPSKWAFPQALESGRGNTEPPGSQAINAVYILCK